MMQLGSLDESDESNLRAFIFAGVIPFDSISNELILNSYARACIPGLHDRLIPGFERMAILGSRSFRRRQCLYDFVRQLRWIYR